MNNEAPLCPDCATAFEAADNYCRKCGMYLAALRDLPVVRTAPEPPAPIVRERAQLPAPVKKAATALAIGTALQLGVNIAGRYLASQATRQAADALRPRAPAKKKDAVVNRDEQPAADPMENVAAISETVMIRRVWIRRS